MAISEAKAAMAASRIWIFKMSLVLFNKVKFDLIGIGADLAPQRE
jgi:hypothetical protein